MTDNCILFGEFAFPRTDGLEYLLNEEQSVTDYLFVNEPHDSFSMYFENGFPVFTVPENSERSYCLFEVKHPGRRIRFFCPEKRPNLDSVVWYFYLELLDSQGKSHGLPGQIRVGLERFRSGLGKGKPRFLEILETVRLNPVMESA